MSAGRIPANRPGNHREEGGAAPTPALQDLRVEPIPFRIAKAMVEQFHYLRSASGGTGLCLGVSVGCRLLGVLTLGAGPTNAHRLVEGASPNDCAVLTRFWLSDELPGNSESRVLGVVLRALKRHTTLRFLVAYSDPAQGHLGTIYQATNWTYIGMSEAMPLYDLGDGVPRHSRSLGHVYGTHSVKHFARHGVPVKLIPQSEKHRYIYFLDPSYRGRLRVRTYPYPNAEGTS